MLFCIIVILLFWVVCCYLILMVMWPSGLTPGAAIAEHKTKRTHSSSAIGSHVIFTPFPQWCGDKARATTGLFSEPDMIRFLLTGLQACTLMMKRVCIISQMETWHFLWILFTGFTKLPTCHVFVFWYSANLRDRWTENHRAQRPACLNTAIFSFKEARCLRSA